MGSKTFSLWNRAQYKLRCRKFVKVFVELNDIFWQIFFLKFASNKTLVTQQISNLNKLKYFELI